MGRSLQRMPVWMVVTWLHALAAIAAWFVYLEARAVRPSSAVFIDVAAAPNPTAWVHGNEPSAPGRKQVPVEAPDSQDGSQQRDRAFAHMRDPVPSDELADGDLGDDTAT